jgi:hypothetical protein
MPSLDHGSACLLATAARFRVCRNNSPPGKGPTRLYRFAQIRCTALQKSRKKDLQSGKWNHHFLTWINSGFVLHLRGARWVIPLEKQGLCSQPVTQPDMLNGSDGHGSGSAARNDKNFMRAIPVQGFTLVHDPL